MRSTVAALAWPGERRQDVERSTIDFVCDQERGENWIRHESKLVFLEIENTGPDNVRRHQIGSELDAIELGSECVRQGLDQQGLRHPGDALDERMLVGENRDQRKVNRERLADDHFGDLSAGSG